MKPRNYVFVSNDQDVLMLDESGVQICAFSPADIPLMIEQLNSIQKTKPLTADEMTMAQKLTDTGIELHAAVAWVRQITHDAMMRGKEDL